MTALPRCRASLPLHLRRPPTGRRGRGRPRDQGPYLLRPGRTTTEARHRSSRHLLGRPRLRAGRPSYQPAPGCCLGCRGQSRSLSMRTSRRRLHSGLRQPPLPTVWQHWPSAEAGSMQPQHQGTCGERNYHLYLVRCCCQHRSIRLSWWRVQVRRDLISSCFVYSTKRGRAVL